MTGDESPDNVFTLTPGDLISPTWARLKRHMEARLQSLRAKNDNDLDPIATAKLRGEIKVLKNLIALSETNQSMVADDE